MPTREAHKSSRSLLRQQSTSLNPQNIVKSRGITSDWLASTGTLGVVKVSAHHNRLIHTNNEKKKKTKSSLEQASTQTHRFLAAALENQDARMAPCIRKKHWAAELCSIITASSDMV